MNDFSDNKKEVEVVDAQRQAEADDVSGSCLWGKSRAHVSRFFASAPGSAVLALMSVLSAAYISVCSTDILSQAKSLLGWNFSSHFELFTAFVLSAIAVLIVWLRERGLADQTVIKERSLDRQQKEMEGRLTNMPPMQFIFEYVEAIRSIGELRRLTKQEHAAGAISKDVLGVRIRTMLSSILSLTRLWDGVSQGNRDVVYQANIMNFMLCSEFGFENSDDEDMFAKWVVNSEFFLHHQSWDVIKERCTGIVFVAGNDYSASSIGAVDAPDPDLEDIFLPYTTVAEYKVGFHHPTIPGAPMVAASERSEYLNSTQTIMRNWLENEKFSNREINDRYYNGLNNYYGGLKSARSILSIPIYCGDEFIAILNINRDCESMLLNRERSEQFVNFMKPICYQLGKMLSLTEDF